MNGQIAEMLAADHKFQSMFASCVSNAINLIGMLTGEKEANNDPDMREEVIRKLSNLIGEHSIDKTSWGHCKDTMKYDVYLMMRRETNTLTQFDLTRPGLSEWQFTDLSSYFDHYQRVNDKRKTLESKGTINGKTCSKCGMHKPVTSFKRGSVCNSCRSRAYRERKANETQPGE